MIVTEILPLDQKKKRVCIDGFYTFPLYLSEVKKYHLSEGAEIADTSLEEIKDVLKSRLYERILYYITDSDHSERDIRKKMRQAGYPEDIVDDCIDRLKSYRLIDDERYAVTYANSLVHAHHKNRVYIKNKLYEKGISKDLIDQVMDTLEINHEELILEALRKKKCSPEEWEHLSPQSRQKIYTSLLRQGFRSEEIQRVLHTSFYE